MAEILVVEDEKSINELICKNLKLMGHRCIQAFDGGTRTVDVHVQRLRQKLHLEKHIVTIYKLGYRLEAGL